MAEIEFFVDPINKNYDKFNLVSHIELPLWSRDLQNNNQEVLRVNVNDAVNNNLISNQTLAYFMVRTYL